MNLRVLAACAVVVFGAAGAASAQSWTGAYVGGAVGSGMVLTTDDEKVVFDTNLDGSFGDTVRTGAGVDAFSPGFCGGLATGAVAAAGCADDEDGIDFGGRVGYDWQMGAVVFGGLVDVAKTDVTDYATAFSTTPAFYSFARNVNYTAGFRGRIGAGTERVLVYGTAGPAWGSIGQAFTSSNTANAFVAINQDGDADDDGFVGESVWGYQAGGGVDVRVGAGWALTGEYLFSSFDNREDSTIRSTQGTAPPTNPFILVNPAGTDLQRTDALTFHVIRVGLSYRF